MIKKRMEMRGQGGFTLIELLVVIAILGILAGVVVFAVGNINESAKQNACKIEKRTMKTAVEAAKGSNESPNVGSWLESTSGEFFTASGTGSTASFVTKSGVTLPSGC
ncbi:MAG: type II secretion system protein [Microthrixaceae bacterium]|nr:type II secretion system protein [Microthrixaceae bacterium]